MVSILKMQAGGSTLTCCKYETIVIGRGLTMRDANFELILES